MDIKEEKDIDWAIDVMIPWTIRPAWATRRQEVGNNRSTIRGELHGTELRLKPNR